MAAPQLLLYRPSNNTPQDFIAHMPAGWAWAASPSWYTNLSNLLGANLHGLNGRSVIINGMGSMLFADSGVGIGPTGDFGGEPSEVAALVGNGYVWVDACALPATVRMVRLLYGVPVINSDLGWHPEKLESISVFAYPHNNTGTTDLMTSLGIPRDLLAAYPESPNPQTSAPAAANLTGADGGRFPYPTAFVVNTLPDAWPSSFVQPGSAGIPANLSSALYGRGTYQGHPQFAYVLFGVHYGAGLYVYVDVNNGKGVTPQDTATFIFEALASRTPISPPSNGAPAPITKKSSLKSSLTTDLLIAGGVIAGGVVLVGGLDFLAHLAIAKAGAGHGTTIIEEER